jgi:hypothetical protein
VCAGGSCKSCLHRRPTQNDESRRPSRARLAPRPFRRRRPTRRLYSPRTHLRPRAAGPDVSTRKNSTHSSSSNYMYEQTRRRRESWLGRLSTRTSNARPSHFITLTVTHCTFCRCAARGPVPDRRAPALGLACLCSYVFIIMELYRRVNLSTRPQLVGPLLVCGAWF